MAGQMQHVKHPVAEVEDVAFIQQLGERSRRKLVVFEPESFVRESAQPVAPDPGAGAAVVQIRSGEDRLLGWVSEPYREFMGATHMVEVAMGADGLHRTLAQGRN